MAQGGDRGDEPEDSGGQDVDQGPNQTQESNTRQTPRRHNLTQPQKSSFSADPNYAYDPLGFSCIKGTLSWHKFMALGKEKEDWPKKLKNGTLIEDVKTQVQMEIDRKGTGPSIMIILHDTLSDDKQLEAVVKGINRGAWLNNTLRAVYPETEGELERWLLLHKRRETK